MKWDIDQLNFDEMKIERGYVYLSGMGGADLVACMSRDLLREVIAEAGADLCAEIHDLVEATDV
jgi:hypothetical protein